MSDENMNQQTEVKQAKLPDVQEPNPIAHDGQIDVLLDTTMPVEVRLGEVAMEVRDLIKLSPGSIITLDKMVGEPLDLYLKGVRFATGQLVVAGDALGVRLTQILPRRKTDRTPLNHHAAEKLPCDEKESATQAEAQTEPEATADE